ncbi:MAG: DUF362 domain-containing protein [Planctomycetota bacterium]
MKNLDRRQFLRTVSILGVGALTTNYLKINAEDKSNKDDPQGHPVDNKPLPKMTLAVVEGEKPAEATLAAINILGGISQFVKKGSVVVIKPNFSWERGPESAASTNPDVLSAVIKECFKAGAKKVKIIERTCNDSKKCYQVCGIEKVVQETGAETVLLSSYLREYKEVKIPNGKEMIYCLIAKEVLECDTFINIPIAKHHGLTKLTLGIKNLMGIIGIKRSDIHHNIGQKLAEILAVARPHLTIIDAYRVLVRNGPTGGSPKDTVLLKKIIACTDPVAADSYAATLTPFGLQGKDIGYIKASYNMGLGEMDITKLNIIEKKI